ncbi:DUF2264 domain-containing protein [Treponema sp. OttesenSCG-928-L16]|nr:DUF2264 domain-containing protein [Treponema sp. OttesenSCG-928-L16]
MNSTSFESTLSHNPLAARADVKQSLRDILEPLQKYAVNGGYQLGNTSAHYAPGIARMEGWSRTLWGIAPLLAGGGDFSGLDTSLAILKEGINPRRSGYWGLAEKRDQRLVEMAAIALSLMISPEYFWDALSAEEQGQLYTWLAQIETLEVADNNWHFFRVLVCTAFRERGLPVNEAAEKESFDFIESCYRDDGWYSDGIGGMYDFYNPFGFHFYGLVYAKIAGRRDAERAEKYIERARLFARHFINWFREDGSFVPYGRSLGYRFAAASFFSACAFADLEVLPWGVMKGIVLRNFRYWFSRPIFDNGGVLSIGYAYPNLIMADQYNSPGSPYWSLKTYLILALPEAHPFWDAEELPLPELPPVHADPVPGFIVSRSHEDVQLLVPGKYPAYQVVHAAAKYAKFAYSARFGFCTAHSSYDLEKTGCDSSLLFSEGDGYWRERRNTEDIRSGENWTCGVWKPWEDVRVFTLLAALGRWHIRIHRIESGRSLETAEGGFSLPLDNEGEKVPYPENRSALSSQVIIQSAEGVSRIAALEEGSCRRGEALIPSPNLNILYPRVMIPLLRGRIEPGHTLLISAVRAGDPAASEEAMPAVHLNGNKTEAEIFYPGRGPLEFRGWVPLV